MEKSKTLTWTELRVGLVALASLLILAVTILYVGGGGGSPLAPKYQVRALMWDVNGLKAGAPVRVGGVEVGHVTRVEFAGAGAGGMVEVGMRLDRRVKDRVTTKSEVTLGSLGLLGERAVDISAGIGGTPVEDGGYVSAAAFDPFKGLLSDASQSTTHLRRILSRMDAGEGAVGRFLRDDELYQRMVDVSLRLEKVLDKLESSRGPLGRLVNDRALADSLAASARGLEAFATRLEAGQGTLGALSKDDALAADLKSLTSRLDDLLGRMQRGEGTAGRLVQDDSLYRRIDGASARLDSLLDRLDRGEGTAARLIRDPELYDGASTTLDELRSFISELRRDPRKYLRVKVSLF
jgi:phospholipid/cholesterol/gamma-HCH transport system substrate-binding protein